MMIDKEGYCRFVYEEGKKLKDLYGDVWTASLINEKNFNKSSMLHNIFVNYSCGIKKINSFLFYVFSAFVRYLKFIFNRFYFKKFRNRINNRKVVFSYYGSHVKFFTNNTDCFEIVLPQKCDYKRVREAGIATVHSFIKWYDFISVPAVYFFNLANILFPTVFRGIFYGNCVYKNDFMRSFVGDVCIESLFYSIIFKRISSLLDPFAEVYYVYEGQGWEKLLCKYMRFYKRIGIVCSAVSNDLINFFPIKEDYVPDKLVVLGNEQKKEFSKYHPIVTIYGAGRYSSLRNIKWKWEKDRVLILLPYDLDMALSLFNFVVESNISGSNIYIRKHPYTCSAKLDKAIKNKYREDVLGLDDSLKKSKVVVVFGDTSTAFDAIAYGCLVVVVNLKEYVQLSCLANSDLSVTISDPKELYGFIESNFCEHKFPSKNDSGKRQKLLSEYFDFSVNEKQMVDRILNE